MHIRYRMIAWILIVLFSGSMFPACAGKNPPTVARDVAVQGKALIDAIQSAQKAVADAEASGALPRNAAVTVMESFQKVGQAGEQAANSLDSLVTMAAGTAETATVIQRIQAALEVINTGLLEALVPIGDEATRLQVSKLATSVSHIITQINLDLLNRR